MTTTTNSTTTRGNDSLLPPGSVTTINSSVIEITTDQDAEPFEAANGDVYRPYQSVRFDLAKILRRTPAGMFEAIKGLASAHGGHWIFVDEMPEGSALAGIDADDHFWEVGPFRASSRFVGISGRGRWMTYTSPSGEVTNWVRRPGSSEWTTGGGGAERPSSLGVLDDEGRGWMLV